MVDVNHVNPLTDTRAKTHRLKTGVETHNQPTNWNNLEVSAQRFDDWWCRNITNYYNISAYISIQPTNNLGISTHGPCCLGRSPPRAWRATRRWAPWARRRRRRRRCRRGAAQCSCLGWKSSQVNLQRWGYEMGLFGKMGMGQNPGT